jgi:hypothetical protein
MHTNCSHKLFTAADLVQFTFRGKGKKNIYSTIQGAYFLIAYFLSLEYIRPIPLIFLIERKQVCRKKI